MYIKYKMNLQSHEKRSRAKKGGSVSTIATEASGLVVPWAILLAKQALQGMMDGKSANDDVGVAVSKTAAKTAKPPKTNKSVKTKSAKNIFAESSSRSRQSGGDCSRSQQSGGGNCASCTGSSTARKGGSSPRSDRAAKVAYKQYNDLASKIQEFLARY